MESPLLPEPSRSVFLGILRKTLGVDPGMTPCPVPGLWGTSQLGIKPVLAVSRILVALRLAILTGWRRQRYRTVKESYTTTRRETGDKWGVASLNMQPFFFLYVRFKIFSVKKLQQSANPIDFTQTMLAGGLEPSIFHSKEEQYQLCKQVVSPGTWGLANVFENSLASRWVIRGSACVLACLPWLFVASYSTELIYYIVFWLSQTNEPDSPWGLQAVIIQYNSHPPLCAQYASQMDVLRVHATLLADWSRPQKLLLSWSVIWIYTFLCKLPRGSSN